MPIRSRRILRLQCAVIKETGQDRSRTRKSRGLFTVVGIVDPATEQYAELDNEGPEPKNLDSSTTCQHSRRGTTLGTKGEGPCVIRSFKTRIASLKERGSYDSRSSIRHQVRSEDAQEESRVNLRCRAFTGAGHWCHQHHIQLC